MLYACLSFSLHFAFILLPVILFLLVDFFPFIHASSFPNPSFKLNPLNDPKDRSVAMPLSLSIPNFSNIDFPSFSNDLLKFKASQKNALNMGGLEIWTTMASNLRKQVRTNHNLTSEMIYSLKERGIANMTSEVQTIVNPVLSFVGIQFIMAILLLLLSPAIFFIFILPHAGKNALSLKNLKKKNRLGSKSRKFWILFFGLLCVLELNGMRKVINSLFSLSIVIICALVGNFTLSMGISNTFSSVITAFQAINVFLSNLKPTVIHFFNSASQFGNTTIVNLTTLPSLTAFFQEANTKTNELSTSLVHIANALKFTVGNITLFNTTLKYLHSNLSSLNSQLTWTVGNTSSLNNVHTVPGSGEVYQLINPIPVPSNVPSIPQYNLSFSSDLALLAFSLQTLPNFTSLATTLNTQITFMASEVTSRLLTGRQQFKAQLTSVLQSSNASLLATIDNASFISTANDLLTQFYTDIQSITPIVQQADTARYYFHLVMSLLCLFSFVVIGLAVASRSKKPVTCCACSSLLFSILFFALTGVYFILALIWGEACQQLDPTSPMLTVSAIVGNSNPTMYAKVAISTVDYCKQNYSLFDALAKSNITSIYPGLSSLNFSSLALSALNELNFTSIALDAINIQPSQYVNLNVSTLEFQLQYVRQLQINSSSIDKLSFNQSQLEPLVSSSFSLTSLSQSVTPQSFAYGQLYSSNRQLNAVDDFKSRIDQVQLSYASLNQTIEACNQTLQQLKLYARNIVTSLNQLSLPSTTVLSQYANLMDFITSYITQLKTEFLQQRIPSTLQSISQFVQSSQTEIGSELSCNPLGLSYYALVNGFCITLLGGLDAVWLAFFCQAIFALAAITTFRQLRKLIVQATTPALLVKEKYQEGSIHRHIKASSSLAEV